MCHQDVVLKQSMEQIYVSEGTTVLFSTKDLLKKMSTLTIHGGSHVKIVLKVTVYLQLLMFSK